LSGAIDEVILLEKALTAAEINDYKSRRVTGADNSRIIGLWHFDEKTGTTAAASSGHGHTATLKSGAAWITSDVPR
jgi:hypothetical protein